MSRRLHGNTQEVLARSMPEAPTWLGRASDQLAWRLPWRWLPRKR